MVSHRARAGGFSYWFILLALCLTSLAGLKLSEAWQTEARREQELQLLFIGEQYRRAIASYYANTPGLSKAYPREMSALLNDDRTPVARHHIRRLYGDPVSQDKAFLVIRGTQGEILGVQSTSQKEPLKKAGFSIAQDGFKGAEHYSDWKFIFTPPGSSFTTPATPPVH